jgi:hypothetical protein
MDKFHAKTVKKCVAGPPLLIKQLMGNLSARIIKACDFPAPFMVTDYRACQSLIVLTNTFNVMCFQFFSLSV